MSLQITGLNVRLGGHPILTGIDLDIADHEFVSVIGPSGCGKTTLLGAVAGFVPIDSGEIRAQGELVDGPGPDRAMVFQDDAVFPWMRVHSNVAYGLASRGMSRNARNDVVARCLDLVGLTASANLWPRQLSGGMRKRVDIARALAVDPPTLLMDEPYGALDMMTKQRLQAELGMIFEQSRMTVLFVTHDLEEALYLADRVIVLAPRPGRVAGILSVPLARPRPPELKLSPQFQQLRGQLAAMLHSVDPSNVGQAS